VSVAQISREGFALKPLVAAIDVGSPSKMGWASSTGTSGCGDPTEFIEHIAYHLDRDRTVALGFEAPLWVPRSRSFSRITANRGGIEAMMRRPWSAGAGCGALAAGIANMASLLETLHRLTGPMPATTQLARLVDGSAKLLIWEAFVSGELKAQTHAGDAELAVTAFETGWPQLRSAVVVEPSVNLAAATLMASGHTVEQDELGMPGIVIAALPRASTPA
jgi:hypothetical protein